MTPHGTNVLDFAVIRRSLPQIGAKVITFVPAVAVVAMVTGGCSMSSHPAAHSPARAGSDGVQRVTIATTDGFRFAPGEVTVKTGMIVLTLTDTGSYPHNISFPGLHRTSTPVSGSPGQSSTTLLLSVTTPGRYGFECTYHSSAGMKGELVVLQGS